MHREVELTEVCVIKRVSTVPTPQAGVNETFMTCSATDENPGSVGTLSQCCPRIQFFFRSFEFRHSQLNLDNEIRWTLGLCPFGGIVAVLQ